MSLKTQVSYQKSGVDHIYVNLEAYNSTSQIINADFNETFNQIVLQKPSDYELAIVRFSSPGTNIPIFIFNQTSNYYTVTLSDVTGNYQKAVQLIQEDFSDTPSANFVFSYQNFVNMINVAFAGAYADLLAGNPGTTALSPPFMFFDPTSLLIRIAYPRVGYSVQTLSASGAAESVGVKVYMNVNLSGYFESFPAKYYGAGLTAGKDVQLKVFDDGDNTLINKDPGSATNANSVYKSYTNTNIPAGVYYMMEQEYSTLYLWNDFSSVVITSSTIPVNKEYLPKINGQINVQPILTDFQPNVNLGPDAKSTLQYIPPGEYRMIDLVSDTPLNQFQFSVYWTDHTQSLYPLQLSPTDYVSIKILFRRKGAPYAKPIQDVRIVENVSNHSSATLNSYEGSRIISDNEVSQKQSDQRSVAFLGNSNPNLIKQRILRNQ
jgi:hypothetical protein